MPLFQSSMMHSFKVLPWTFSSAYYHSLLLLLLGVSGQQLQQYPSCQRYNIARSNLQSDCTNWCSPYNATYIDNLQKPNLTNPVFYDVWGCNCEGVTGKACRSRSVILDTSAPIGTCQKRNISTIQSCTDFCQQQLDEFFGSFLLLNRTNEYSCSCSAHDVCSDSPTCSQLMIYPNTAANDCQTYCSPTNTGQIFYQDKIEAVGTTKVYLHLSCSCGPNVSLPSCDDKILLTDETNLPNCTTLQIVNFATCSMACSDLKFSSIYGTNPTGSNSRCNCVTVDGQMITICQNQSPQSPPSSSSGIRPTNTWKRRRNMTGWRWLVTFLLGIMFFVN